MTVAANQRVIYPGAISAPTPHETARAIVRVLTDPSGKGAKKNAPTKAFFTEDELKKVAGIIERQQAGEAQPSLANVPELRRHDSLERVKDLNRFLRQPIVAETDRAGFSAISIDAFWAPEHRAVAQLVTERFGHLPTKERVDSGAIERAHALISDRQALLQQLPESVDIPEFDTRLTEIRDFMNSGRSGLCNHGPVNIYGQIFDQVLRLPFLPAYPPPAPTKSATQPCTVSSTTPSPSMKSASKRPATTASISPAKTDASTSQSATTDGFAKSRAAQKQPSRPRA